MWLQLLQLYFGLHCVKFLFPSLHLHKDTFRGVLTPKMTLLLAACRWVLFFNPFGHSVFWLEWLVYLHIKSLLIDMCFLPLCSFFLAVLVVLCSHFLVTWWLSLVVVWILNVLCVFYRFCFLVTMRSVYNVCL